MIIVDKRNIHLRHAINQCNSLLYYRMASRGSLSTTKMSLQDIQYYPELTAENIATLCPTAAEYSLHYPMLRCTEGIQRILRFIETECEVLPSKERCPYLVTLEVLEQNTHVQNDFLYTQKTNAQKYNKHKILDNNKERIISNSVTAISTSSSGLTTSDMHSTPQLSSVLYRRPYLSSRSGVSRRGSLLSDSMRRVKIAEQQQYSRSSTSRDSSSTTSSRTAVIAAMSITERENIDQQTPHLSAPQQQSVEKEVEVEEEVGSQQGVGNIEEDNDQLKEQLQQAYAALDATTAGTTTANVAANTPPSYQQHSVTTNSHHFSQPPAAFKNTPREDSVALQVIESEYANNHVDHANHSINSNGSSSLSKEKAETQLQPDLETACVPNKSSTPSTTTNISTDNTGTTAATATSTTTSYTERIRGGSDSEQQQAPSPVVYVHKRTYQRRRKGATVPSKKGNTVARTIDIQQQHVYMPPLPTTSSIYHHPATTTILSDSTYTTTTSPPPPSNTDTVPMKSSHGIAISNSWAEKKALLRAQSPFGKLPGWNIRSFIVKSGDDLRKEVSS